MSFNPFNFFKTKNLDKYKFLFRNDIFSHPKRDKGTIASAYHLAPVMRGKASKPYYLYLPESNHYLVCSYLEHFGFRRYDTYAPPHPELIHSYVVLDDTGHELHSLETDFYFSIKSGLFFTPDFYINWLESGDSTKISYAGIYNRDVKMNTTQFIDKFRELYSKADYMEYVNLRSHFNNEIDKAVVFKINKEWFVLLDGIWNSHIYSDFGEDSKTGVDIYKYSLKFDYNDSDKNLKDPYPQAEPLLESIYLETKDRYPYWFNRRVSHDGLKMTKFQKISSTGWEAFISLLGIPIYFPGTTEGIAYMEYKIGDEMVCFKIPDVTKQDYLWGYSLGVRTFKLPAEFSKTDSLVFIESLQNYGHELRDGGGIYVMRPWVRAQSDFSSLPNGISEECYAELPRSLQIAIMNLEDTMQLIVNGWYPEIILLRNLTYLKITEGLDSLPDEISKLINLEVLDLEGSGVYSISNKLQELKHLKLLNLNYTRSKIFPEEICKLSELTHLYISGPTISEIPESIGNLTKLRELNLFAGSRIKLPETMVGMKGLRIRGADDLKEAVPDDFHFLFEKREN